MSPIRAAFLVVALLGGCDSPVPAATASPPVTEATATPANPATTPVTTTPVAMNVPTQASAALDLHTTGQTYFGDLRGQVHPVTQP